MTSSIGRPPKPNDRVLFVAMNNSAAHRSTAEADALKARGTQVTVVQDTMEDDVLTTQDGAGRTVRHDLGVREGAMSFALTLNLPAEQTKAIAEALLITEPDGRDELAQLAQQWARVELGGEAPSRLILSGHNLGAGVYGDYNGMLNWPALEALAAAMPRGAGSVEDLLVSSCYSGGQQLADLYLKMFPNLKTIVGYDSTSPGAASGAIGHQKLWEAATRGASEGVSNGLFLSQRKGENVIVWTRSEGLDESMPIEQLKASQSIWVDAFDLVFSGTDEVYDPQAGPVREYYTLTQRLIQHSETTPEERVELELRRDQTARLLFYKPVSARFQETYAAEISAGYTALGLPPPDFKTLKRREALESVRAFQEKLASQTPPPEAATKLAPILQDFIDLKRTVLPDTWVS